MMFRNSFSKIIILTALLAGLVAATVLGQSKPAGEIDIAKCWSYPASDGGGSALVSDGVRLYVGGEGGRVVALSLDGKKMWSSEFGGDISSNLLTTDTGLFLVTATVSSEVNKGGGTLLRSLSKETGITNWTAKLPNAGSHYLNQYQGAVIVVSKNGVILSINLKTGTVKWKREIAEGFAADPKVFAEKLVVASTVKQVFVISLATGEIDSMRKLVFGVTAVGQTAAGDLIVGDERGNLTSFLGSTEKVNWKFRSGGEISAIITVDDHILVTSYDNFVYSLVTRNGSVAWKRRLSGRVSRIATLEDRYVFMSGFDDHGAVVADLANGRVAGQIVLGDDESLSQNPIAASGLIVVLTSDSIRSFSLNGCSFKKESGPGK